MTDKALPTDAHCIGCQGWTEPEYLRREKCPGLNLDAARVAAPSDGLDAAALERAFVAVIDRRPLRVEVAYHYGADIPVEHQRQAFLRDVVTEYARVAAPSDGLREWLADPLRDYLDDRDRAYLAALAATEQPETGG
jgi:hypothetical protein